jgi:hypothetical protein
MPSPYPRSARAARIDPVRNHPDSRRQDRKIPHRLVSLSWRNHHARHEPGRRSGSRRSALCVVQARSVGSRTPGMVFDRPILVGRPLGFPAEQAGHRSRRQLLLAILCYRHIQHGKTTCGPVTYPRIDPDLFLFASIAGGHTPEHQGEQLIQMSLKPLATG